MSQVRKLKGGAKFTIDSRSWNASNQAFMEDLDKHINRAPAKLKPYLETVIPDLKSGRSVIVNRPGTRSDFSKPTIMSDDEWARAHNPRSTTRNYWDSIVGSEYNLLNQAIAYLGSYEPSSNVESVPTPNKRTISAEKSEFDYNKGTDGKYSYSNSTPRNAGNIQRALDWYSYLSGDTAGEGYDDWDVSGYKDVDAIKSWFAGLENPKQYFDDVIARTKAATGKWTPEDEDFWRWMNITWGPDSTSSSSGSGSGSGSGNGGNGSGSEGDDEGEVSQLIEGEDGNYYINPDWKWEIDTSSKPYIITNDDDTFGPDYHNWVIYKNRLYNNNAAWADSELGPIMQNYMAIRNSREPEDKIWNRLKEIAQWRSSGMNYPLYLFDADTSNFTRGYYPFFSNEEYRNYSEPDEYGTVRTGYRPIYLGDITTSYSNLPTGYRIVSYYPKSDNYSQSNWGFENPQYAVFVPGSEDTLENVTSYPDEAAMLNALSQYGVKRYGDIIYSNLPNATEFNEKGYAVVLQGKTIEGKDFNLLYSKNDRQYYISSKNGKKTAVVKPNLLRKILAGNPISGIESETGEINGGKGDYLPITYPDMKKLGGKINNLRKYSIGGDFQGYTSQSTMTTQDIEAPFERPAQLSTNWRDWPTPDKIQAFAVAGDVLGAIASVAAGPGSAVGAGAGLASSIGYLTSDIARDNNLSWGEGFDFLINVAFDAATLAPVVGEGAKLAKISKAITKSARVLTPLLSGIGAYRGAAAVDKAVKGEKLTVDDLQALAAGLQGIIGIGHMTRQGIGEAQLSREAKRAEAGITDDMTRQQRLAALQAANKTHKASLLDKNGRYQDVELNSDQIKTITDSKTPEETLAKIIKEQFSDKNISDTALDAKDLLSKFNFEVERGTIRRNKIKGAKEKEDVEDITLWNELHPFAPWKGNKRASDLETAITNPQVRAQLDKYVGRDVVEALTTSEPDEMGFVIDRTTRTIQAPTQHGLAARAYANLYPEQRVNDSKLSWFRRTFAPETSQTRMTVGGRKFNPEVSVSEQRRFAPNPRPQPTPYNEIPSSGRVIYGQESGPSMLKLKEEYTTPQALVPNPISRLYPDATGRQSNLKPATEETPNILNTQLDPVKTDGWWNLSSFRNMSVQDATSMVLETNNVSDAMQVLRRLPSQKRTAVLKRLALSDNKLAKQIVSHYNAGIETTGIKRSMALLDKIKNSKDPTATLETMMKNPAVRKLINDDPQSFYMAVEQNPNIRSESRTGRRNRYSILKKVSDLFAANGMSINGLRFKNGGKVIKAQNGTALTDEQMLALGFNKPSPLTFKTNTYTNGLATNISMPSTIASNGKITQTKDGQIILPTGGFGSNASVPLTTDKWSLKTQPWNTSYGMVGGPNYAYDAGQWVNDFYSKARLGSSILSAYLNKKYTNKALDSLGVTMNTPVQKSMPRFSSAVEDRMLNEVNAQRSKSLPVSSNQVINNLTQLTNQQQSLAQTNQILSQLSNKFDQYQNDVRTTLDENNAFATEAMNEYRQNRQNLKNTVAMQKAQANNLFVNSVGQSINNYLYQNQTNAYNNRQKALGLRYQYGAKPIENEYNANVSAAYKDVYGAEWAALSDADKLQYGSIDAYARSKHPEDFSDGTSMITRKLNDAQSRYLEDLGKLAQWTVIDDSSDLFRGWTRRYLDNTWWRERENNPSYKKGGRLNGTTRYTLEPDERIWIEQNKAAMKAASKFNDNIIKLFLKLK